MPIALLIELIQAFATLAPALAAAGQEAVQILQSGTATPDQETTIRSQLDAVKAQIDAA